MVYVIIFSICSFLCIYLAQKDEDGISKKIGYSFVAILFSLLPTFIISLLVMLTAAAVLDVDTVTRTNQYEVRSIKVDDSKDLYAQTSIESTLVTYSFLAGNDATFNMIDVEANKVLFVESDRLTLESYEMNYSESARYWFWSSPAGYTVYKAYLPEAPTISDDYDLLSGVTKAEVQ